MKAFFIQEYKFLILFFSIFLMSIFGVNAVGVNYLDIAFVPAFFPYELAMALFTILFWFFISKKDSPLRMNSKSFTSEKNLSHFLLPTIIAIPLLLTITFTYTTTKNFDWVIFLKLVGVSIAVGFNEEFVFRLVGLNAVLRHTSPVKAMLISSLIFGLFHLTNLFSGMGSIVIFQVINASLLGFVFAYIYLKTGSIFYTVILHGLWDFSSFSSAQFVNKEYALANFPFVIFLTPLFLFFIAKDLKKDRNNKN